MTGVQTCALPIFGRMQLPGREPGAVQHRPEAVAGTGEVMPRRSGIEAGIDAAEQDPEVVRDHVGNCGRARGLQFLPCRLEAVLQLSSGIRGRSNLPSSRDRNSARSRASDSEIDMTQRASSRHHTLKRTWLPGTSTEPSGVSNRSFSW